MGGGKGKGKGGKGGGKGKGGRGYYDEGPPESVLRECPCPGPQCSPEQLARNSCDDTVAPGLLTHSLPSFAAAGELMHTCEGEMVCKSLLSEKVSTARSSVVQSPRRWCLPAKDH